jgi:hypothetical protein
MIKLLGDNIDTIKKSGFVGVICCALGQPLWCGATHLCVAFIMFQPQWYSSGICFYAVASLYFPFLEK